MIDETSDDRGAPSSLVAALAATPRRVEDILRSARTVDPARREATAHLLAEHATRDRRVVLGGAADEAEEKATRDLDEHVARLRHFRARLVESVVGGVVDRATAETAASFDGPFLAALIAVAATPGATRT